MSILPPDLFTKAITAATAAIRVWPAAEKSFKKILERRKRPLTLPAFEALTEYEHKLADLACLTDPPHDKCDELKCCGRELRTRINKLRHIHPRLLDADDQEHYKKCLEIVDKVEGDIRNHNFSNLSINLQVLKEIIKTYSCRYHIGPRNENSSNPGGGGGLVETPSPQKGDGSGLVSSQREPPPNPSLNWALIISGFILMAAIFSFADANNQKKPPNDGSKEKPPPPASECSSSSNDVNMAQKYLLSPSSSNLFNSLYGKMDDWQADQGARGTLKRFKDIEATQQVMLMKQYLARLEKELVSAKNNDDTERVKKYQERMTLIQRFLPLMNILANNEVIDNVAGTSPIFSIGVIVPFTNQYQGSSEQDEILQKGPHPWSLGVLKGIDLAQKAITKMNDADTARKIYFKALIFDDGNDIRRFKAGNRVNDSLVKFLSTPINEFILGVIGHNQSLFIKKLQECYNQQKLPLLSTSLPSNATNQDYVHSLLPSTIQISSYFGEFLKRQRSLRGFANKNFRLLVFFDQRDSRGREIASNICENLPTECSQKSINIARKEPLELQSEIKKLIGDHGIHNIEVFLSLNPNTDRENITSVVNNVLDPLREALLLRSEGPYRVYVGPDFADEALENEIRRNHLQSGSQEKVSLDIVRVGPVDWRINRHPAMYSDPKSSDYGIQFNWNTYNAYNALMIFHALLDNITNKNHVSSYSQGGFDDRRKSLLAIRKNINAMINSDYVQLPGERQHPSNYSYLRDTNPGSPLVLAGPGFQVCATSIFAPDIRECNPPVEK